MAQEEEKRRQDRIALAEREARTKLLRDRARGGGQVVGETSQGNQVVDIFEGVDQGKGDRRANMEHEKEEKAKKEEWEQRVGILTYLHKKETEVDSPWYLKGHEQRVTRTKEISQDSKITTSLEMHDPLIVMKRTLDLMKTQPSILLTTSTSKTSTSSTSGINKEREEHGEQTKQRHSRHKSKKKHKHREHKEDKKSKRKEKKKHKRKDDDERSRRFNSQFNPHLSKN